MKRYGRFIEYRGLQDWWNSLSKDEQQFINRVGGHVDSPSVVWTSQTPSQFLWSLSSWAILRRHYDLASRMLEEALRRSTNAVDTHFSYNQLIDMCCKRREESLCWLDKCIEYCKADIAIFPEFKKAYIAEQRRNWIKRSRSPLSTPDERERYSAKAKGEISFNISIPSFQRLAIIYEKQARYEEAIEICEEALRYGLVDSTKGGFQGRLRRLHKKLKESH